MRKRRSDNEGQQSEGDDSTPPFMSTTDVSGDSIRDTWTKYDNSIYTNM